MSWSEFWAKVGEAFRTSWNDLGNFWFGGGGNNSPYIANFVFNILFSNVDFPTLGRPTILTNPDLNILNYLL